MAKAYVGISGWSNPKFYNLIYPRGLPQSQMLAEYAKHYPTVEINTTFYSTPPESWLKRWYCMTPKNFVFALKANKFITHIKKLECEDAELKDFLNVASLLGDKLGPVLFQLPASFNPTLPQLEKFVQRLPVGLRYAVELRQPPYEEVGTVQMLTEHNIGFCVHDFTEEGLPYVTADFVYVRMHGPDKLYEGSYSDEQLRLWADRVDEWVVDGKDVYVYFNNTKNGDAIANSLEFMRLLKERSDIVPAKTLIAPSEAYL